MSLEFFSFEAGRHSRVDGNLARLNAELKSKSIPRLKGPQELFLLQAIFLTPIPGTPFRGIQPSAQIAETKQEMIRPRVASLSVLRMIPLLALASAFFAPSHALAEEPSCPPSLGSVVRQFVSRHRHVGEAVVHVGTRSVKEVESIIRDALNNFVFADAFSSTRWRAAAATWNIVVEPVALVMLPIPIAISEARHGLRALWRVPIRYLRWRGAPLAIHVTFALVGPRLLIFADEYLDETDEEFLVHADRGVVVFADLHTDEDKIVFADYNVALRGRYSGRPIIWVSASSFDDLSDQLFKISQTTPIAALDLGGHGAPGGFAIGAEQWIDSEGIRSLRRERTRIRFAPGASIRVSSCNSGLGRQGEEFAQTLGNYYLGERGGRVILSNRYYIGLLPDESVGSAFLDAAGRSIYIQVATGVKSAISYPDQQSLDSVTRSGSIRRVEIPRGGIPASAPQQPAE